MKSMWLIIISTVIAVVSFFAVMIGIFVYVPVLSYIIVILLIAAGSYAYWRYINTVTRYDDDIVTKNGKPMMTITVIKNNEVFSSRSSEIAKDIINVGVSDENDIVISDADWVDAKQFSVLKKHNENTDIYYIKNVSMIRPIYTASDSVMIRGEYKLYYNAENRFRIFDIDSGNCVEVKFSLS